jgi:hypothetical protein
MVLIRDRMKVADLNREKVGAMSTVVEVKEAKPGKT